MPEETINLTRVASDEDVFFQTLRHYEREIDAWLRKTFYDPKQRSGKYITSPMSKRVRHMIVALYRDVGWHCYVDWYASNGTIFEFVRPRKRWWHRVFNLYPTTLSAGPF